MKRTKEDALLTKESIMESALDVFIKRGYSETTTSHILASTPFTKGAFYFHFKSKEDIFQQVIAKELNFISNLIVDSFIETGNEKDKVEHLLSGVMDNFYLNTRFRKVILLTWFRVEVDVDSQILKDKTSFNEFFLEELHKLLISAQQKKLLNKTVNPIEAATHITALILGVYRLYFVAPKYGSDINSSKKLLLSYLNQIFI